jgi:hypothetical protein
MVEVENKEGRAADAMQFLASDYVATLRHLAVQCR